MNTRRIFFLIGLLLILIGVTLIMVFFTIRTGFDHTAMQPYWYWDLTYSAPEIVILGVAIMLVSRVLKTGQKSSTIPIGA